MVSGSSAGVCSISLEGVLEMVKSTVGGSVDADDLLMEAGMDSLGAVELHRILQQLVVQARASLDRANNVWWYLFPQ